jgi:hypothetical protein
MNSQTKHCWEYSCKLKRSQNRETRFWNLWNGITETDEVKIPQVISGKLKYELIAIKKCDLFISYTSFFLVYKMIYMGTIQSYIIIPEH